MNMESGLMEKCPICNRPMTDDDSNIHHLIPKLKGGRKGPTVRLHIECHAKIHSLWSENELRDVYNNIDIIKSDSRMISFSKWISKQKSGKKITHKLTNTHKRKRKR